MTTTANRSIRDEMAVTWAASVILDHASPDTDHNWATVVGGGILGPTTGEPELIPGDIVAGRSIRIRPARGTVDIWMAAIRSVGFSCKVWEGDDEGWTVHA